MNDTAPNFAKLIARRHAEMSPEERMKIASDMFDTARKIVDSSLPNAPSRRDRRLASARRLYNEELPEAALNAFADWQEDNRIGGLLENKQAK
jgi:hypothetical protein